LFHFAPSLTFMVGHNMVVIGPRGPSQKQDARGLGLGLGYR
jgi:hypothetical protein